jgi:hypothetical protein
MKLIFKFSFKLIKMPQLTLEIPIISPLTPQILEQILKVDLHASIRIQSSSTSLSIIIVDELKMLRTLSNSIFSDVCLICETVNKMA